MHIGMGKHNRRRGDEGWSRRDIQIEASRAMHEPIPGCRFGILPPHLSSLEQPEAFTETWTDFLYERQ